MCYLKGNKGKINIHTECSGRNNFLKIVTIICVHIIEKVILNENKCEKIEGLFLWLKL